MSGRGADSANRAAWALASNRPIHLLEMDFNPYVYMTDAAVDINWNGNLYLSSRFLGFSEISETSELLVNTCTVSLSGVDQTVVALLLQETYLNRRVKIRKAMLTEALAIIGTPVLIFDGRMDRPTVVVDPDSGSTVCTVEGVSHWTDFERRPGRHSNDVQQQKFFPGDRGFANVATIPDEIFWGIETKVSGLRTLYEIIAGGAR